MSAETLHITTLIVHSGHVDKRPVLSAPILQSGLSVLQVLKHLRYIQITPCSCYRCPLCTF